MNANTKTTATPSFQSVHGLGVASALAAGVWLGAAEAPTKLVNSGLSPFAISLCMVAGVFTARWTVPTLLKGTRSVFADLNQNSHLIPNAILAGMLWAVANTLTVFAIRDVGLTIAFPLWNTNSLVGILWGRLLFGELKGASSKNIIKVVLGAIAIVIAAVMLGFSTIQGNGHHATHALSGIFAAAGASLLWGTMYVPYRKAYISGMNPLSFVTVFTIGELVTCFALVLALDGGTHAAISSGSSSAASSGSSAISFSSSPPSFSASAAPSRSPTPTSFGASPGAHSSSENWPTRTGRTVSSSSPDRW